MFNLAQTYMNQESLTDDVIAEFSNHLKADGQFGPNPVVKQHGRLTGGWESYIYSLDISHGDQTTAAVVRILHGNNTLDRARHEYDAMVKLNSLGIPIPKPYLSGFFESTKQGYILMERLKGRILGDIIQDPEVENSQDYIIKFVEDFVKLHEADWTRVADRDSAYPIHTDPLAFIGPYLERYAKAIHAHGFEELIPLLEILQDHIEDATCERLSLTHNDYHPFNVMVLENGDHRIIDWPSTDIRDARVDLGWSLMLIRSATNDQLRDIVYDLYTEMSSYEIENIEYFELLASMRRLFDIYRLIFAEDTGMTPEATEAILGEMRQMGINVMLFVNEMTELEFPQLEDVLIYDDELDDDVDEEEE